MPIEELSDQRRFTRDFKVRLGTRQVTATKQRAGKDEAMGRGESYPKETDYFVLEEAPEEVQLLYKEKPKSLRIMLGYEWNQTSPSGEDLVFSLYNRAYGNAKGLKCRGTGRSIEKSGVARTNDESYALRIEKATHQSPKPTQGPGGDPYWDVRCIGRDCPLFLHKVSQPDPNNPTRTVEVMAPGHDRDASCNEIGILRCFLLHPTTDRSDEENYCRTLGIMELATTSIHSIIDVQSGFDLIKPFTRGRTAGIPMTLIRRPTTTYRPVKQTHYTCAIHADQREIQRWAAVPLSEVFLTETQRALLQQLAERPLGLDVDSVRDLIPRRLPEAVAGNGVPTGQATIPEAPVGPVDPVDPPDDGSVAPAGSPTDPAGSPLLVAAQLDELKMLAGGPLDPEKPPDKFTNAWKSETLDRLRAAVVAMRSELDISEPLAFSELRLVHYEWLKERLRALPPNP